MTEWRSAILASKVGLGVAVGADGKISKGMTAVMWQRVLSWGNRSGSLVEGKVCEDLCKGPKERTAMSLVNYI